MNKSTQYQGYPKGEIVIYKSPKNEIEVEARFEGETVWLRQEEIARLYGKERTVITKHINKIFADKELDRKSNVQKLHIANSDKPVAFYNLDVILAVGYRTNSARAIHFRKWATNVLKNYLFKGYVINEKRLLQAKNQLQELQGAISFLFVYYLDKNDFLYRSAEEKKINDNTLTALALLIAVSDPSEKDKLIKIITNLLAI